MTESDFVIEANRLSKEMDQLQKRIASEKLTTDERQAFLDRLGELKSKVFDLFDAHSAK